MTTMDAANTTLTELLQQVQAGNTVIITSGQEKTPVAKVEALGIKASNPRRLGFLETPGFELGPGFWEPLPPGFDGIDEEE